MMKELNKIGTVSIVCSMMLITACSNSPQKPKESASRQQEIQACKNNLPASKKIKQDSIVLGCAGPSIIGRLMDHKTYACVVGSGAGFLLGESVAERKCEYLNLAAQLDGEIAHTNQLNSNFNSVLQEQESKLKRQQAEAKALTANTQTAASNQSALASLQKDLNSQLAKERNTLAQLQEEQQFKQETVNQAQAAHLEQAKTDRLTAEINTLRKNIEKLRVNNQALLNINSSLL